jgi:hypothetical protein
LETLSVVVPVYNEREVQNALSAGPAAELDLLSSRRELEG